MKKINVFFVFVVLLTVMSGFFVTCDLDTATRVTVTFEDPSGGNPTKKVAIVKGESLGRSMKDPTRAGPFVFYGWFEGQSQYFPDTPISVNLTLTARWSDDIAKITFEFTQKDASDNVIQPTADVPPVTAIKGLPLGPLAFPVKPRAKGWAFDSWLLDNVPFTTETVVPGDITLTAKWVPPTVYTVSFNSKGGIPVDPIQVNAGECIDEWVVRFPPPLEDGSNTINPDAFFVAWIDDENKFYDGRIEINRSLTLDAKWGLPPFIVTLRMVADGGNIVKIDTDSAADYGGVDYNARVREAWDSTTEDPKWVIVNETTYDVPNNNNRWRILYRINFSFPSTFSTEFYTRYTIRARFYANRQGCENWKEGGDAGYKPGQFTPNIPAKASGYSEDGWLKRKDYAVPNNPSDPSQGWKEYSRSDDGWGQVSWCLVANWNGAGADAETMLQRYNLDRKGGTINDTWAPLRGKDQRFPPYLLIQTSDNYIGHIEVTEIVFHNGEFEHANYLGEPEPVPGGDD